MKITRQNKEKLLFEMVGERGTPAAVYYVFEYDRQLNYEEIRQYDINDIKREFQKGLDKTSKKARLIFIAAEDHNDVAAVKWLLANGMKPNFTPYDSPLLLHAIKEEHNEIATMLLEYGADANTPDDSGDTMLHKACFYGNFEITKLLIHNHAKVDARNVYGKTPLMEAVHGRNIKLIRFLLDNGADVNAVQIMTGRDAADQRAGMTPLMYAAQGSLEIARLLLDRGADVNAKTNQGMTSLMFAVTHDHSDIVNLLLDRGVDINAKINYNGYNAISYAVASNNAEIVKLLLHRGAACEDIHKDAKRYLNAKMTQVMEEFCAKGSEKK